MSLLSSGLSLVLSGEHIEAGRVVCHPGHIKQAQDVAHLAQYDTGGPGGLVFLLHPSPPLLMLKGSFPGMEPSERTFKPSAPLTSPEIVTTVTRVAAIGSYRNQPI